MLRAEKAALMREISHTVKAEVAKLKGGGSSETPIKGLAERIELLEESVDGIKKTLGEVDRVLGAPNKAKKETAIKE